MAEVPDADALALSSGRSPGAGVHGFGEQFTDFDLDGRLLPIIVREQGIGRGEQPLSLLTDLTQRAAAGTATSTYAAVASWVTEDLRGVALAPDRPGLARLRRRRHPRRGAGDPRGVVADGSRPS